MKNNGTYDGTHNRTNYCILEHVRSQGMLS